MNKKGLFLIGFFCLIFSIFCVSCPNNNNVEQTAPDWAIGEWYTAETFDSDSWCAEVAKDQVDVGTTIPDDTSKKYPIKYGKKKYFENEYPSVASYVVIRTESEFKVSHTDDGFEYVIIHLRKTNNGVEKINGGTEPVYKKPAGN